MAKLYIIPEPKSLLRINRFRPSILAWKNVKPSDDLGDYFLRSFTSSERNFDYFGSTGEV